MRIEEEIKKGERFKFGENWTEFLALIDDERIEVAKESLLEMMGMSTLERKTFLDVGSGSGLFSLAARSLGAKVISFDYDPQSVACAHELKRRYFPDDDNWTISEGNILEEEFLTALDEYDIVYSWGVLHHTGAMWDALANVDGLVKSGGILFISIYNDQGFASKNWRKIKRRYNRGGKFVKWLLTCMVGFYFNLRRIISGTLVYRHPFYYWRQKQNRGMSIKRDLIDWVGGYPFEVAKPEEIFDFFHQRGYYLTKLYTAGSGHACNQYVFVKYLTSFTKSFNKGIIREEAYYRSDI
ncbi:MAG: methyltransferase [Lachnospiraceae bacterium]|jgi:2-polyprenyl-6-hydroxyphenyl methylase/3-demethylubiquinone-9 3-methyltransferase|nr:methyltransferase [Lachnospiraceae bacterium]